jgi:predicted transcriptional regulator
MSDKNKNMEAMAMKMLRQQRPDSISRARKAIKEQSAVIKAIREALTAEPMTIPELAQAVDMETEPVLRYVSTLKKYGIVGEGPKDGDYFKYELTS